MHIFEINSFKIKFLEVEIISYQFWNSYQKKSEKYLLIGSKFLLRCQNETLLHSKCPFFLLIFLGSSDTLSCLSPPVIVLSLSPSQSDWCNESTHMLCFSHTQFINLCVTHLILPPKSLTNRSLVTLHWYWVQKPNYETIKCIYPFNLEVCGIYF